MRGDLALAEELPDPNLASPKMWVYEGLVASQRVQSALARHPDHKLFDGVGFSGLDGLGYQSKKIGRKTVAVMARETLPDPEVFQRWDVEVIHGDEPAEVGYVNKQAEVLACRGDIVPCHQALYGALALAPVGNAVARLVRQYDLNSTFWCIAGGSNLYGIGGKLRQQFPNVRTVVVEPETELTIDPGLDLADARQVKRYAAQKIRHCSLDTWDGRYSGIFPLHIASPNRYLLHLWAYTGDPGFDEALPVSVSAAVSTQRLLRNVSRDYEWTRTTALALTPAIAAAERGENVLVMAYGPNREIRSKDTVITGNWPK